MERKGYFCTSKYYFRMEKLLIITPVKDSIQTTLDTIHAIMESGISVPYTYTIYNDNSTPENTAILEKEAEKYGFRLVNISDLTDHPSPNYLLVLQRAQEEALARIGEGMFCTAQVCVLPIAPKPSIPICNCFFCCSMMVTVLSLQKNCMVHIYSSYYTPFLPFFQGGFYFYL